MADVALQKKAGNNSSLAYIFHRMADCYRYLGAEERFRAIAYENVAKMLHNMQEDISTHAQNIKSLDEIKGIGESIAEKIIEYLHTGKIKTYDELQKKVPFDLLELMDVAGFGPATLKILHEELHISNKDELIKSLKSGKLETLKGFGTKKIENILHALKLAKEAKRLPLKTADEIGNKLLNIICKIQGVQRAEVAGSLRRKKETIGDIDIIILAAHKYRNKIVRALISLPQVAKVIAKGNTKVSVILKEQNIQVDIRLVNDFEFGAALLYFTGNKEHNIKLRTLARNKGYKINEYGIFTADSNKRVAGATEEEMYAFLNLRYIPPEQRLDKGEIEAAEIK